MPSILSLLVIVTSLVLCSNKGCHEKVTEKQTRPSSKRIHFILWLCGPCVLNSSFISWFILILKKEKRIVVNIQLVMTGRLFWKATILGGLYRGVSLYTSVGPAYRNDDSCLFLPNSQCSQADWCLLQWAVNHWRLRPSFTEYKIFIASYTPDGRKHMVASFLIQKCDCVTYMMQTWMLNLCKLFANTNSHICFCLCLSSSSAVNKLNFQNAGGSHVGTTGSCWNWIMLKGVWSCPWIIRAANEGAPNLKREYDWGSGQDLTEKVWGPDQEFEKKIHWFVKKCVRSCWSWLKVTGLTVSDWRTYITLTAWGEYCLQLECLDPIGCEWRYIKKCMTVVWQCLTNVRHVLSTLNFRYHYPSFKLILMVDSWNISCETAPYESHRITDDKTTLVQVTAWCLQAPSHYLCQCCPSPMKPYVMTMSPCVECVFPSIFWAGCVMCGCVRYVWV